MRQPAVQALGMIANPASAGTRKPFVIYTIFLLVWRLVQPESFESSFLDQQLRTDSGRLLALGTFRLNPHVHVNGTKLFMAFALDKLPRQGNSETAGLPHCLIAPLH